MATTTGELALTKPTAGSTDWGNDVNTNFDTTDTNVSNLLYGIQKAEASWTDGDTTPDVSSGALFTDTAWTGPATITTFDGGVAGQIIHFRATTSHVTIDSALIHTGLSMPCQANDFLVWRYDGTNWKQIGGTVGMGSTFVEIDPGDAVGDWVTGSIGTTWTDVDLSDDGVRKGADRALIVLQVSATTTNDATFKMRRNGSTDTSLATEVMILNDELANSRRDRAIVLLDEGGVTEVSFSVSFTGESTHTAYALGYWI